MSDDPIPLGKAIWSNGRTKPRDMIFLQSLLKACGDLSSCALQIRKENERERKKEVYRKVEEKEKKAKKNYTDKPQISHHSTTYPGLKKNCVLPTYLPISSSFFFSFLIHLIKSGLYCMLADNGYMTVAVKGFVITYFLFFTHLLLILLLFLFQHGA